MIVLAWAVSSEGYLRVPYVSRLESEHEADGVEQLREFSAPALFTFHERADAVQPRKTADSLAALACPKLAASRSALMLAGIRLVRAGALHSAFALQALDRIHPTEVLMFEPTCRSLRQGLLAPKGLKRGALL